MCSIQIMAIRFNENFWQNKHILYLKCTTVYTDKLSTIPAILHVKRMNDSSSENTNS